MLCNYFIKVTKSSNFWKSHIYHRGSFILRQVVVSDHIFVPREYLAQQLESQLTQSIHTLISSSEHPMRPCQLLASINAHMIVLQNLDTIGTALFLLFCLIYIYIYIYFFFENFRFVKYFLDEILN